MFSPGWLKWLFAPRSIGQRFALTIGAGTGVILLALATVNYLNSREVLLEQASSEALEAVHDQSRTIDELVDRLAMLPMSIAAYQVANEKQGGVTVEWLASMLESCPIRAVFGLYMILDNQDWKTTDTFRWVSRKSWPGAARLNYDFHDPVHDWYSGAKGTTGTYVSHPYFAEGGSEIEMISITQSVFSKKGSFLGVAGVDVSLQEIQKLVSHMQIREYEKDFQGGNRKAPNFLQKLHGIPWELKEQAYLITSNGSLIAGPVNGNSLGQSLIGKSLDLPGIKEILSNSSGSLRIQNHGDKLLYWAEGSRTGWKLILEVPYSLIVAPARILAVESIVIGVIGLFLLLGVSFVVARRVSSPIRDLQKAAAGFEKGHYADHDGILEFIGKRRDELGRFARSFSAMIGEIRNREERLSRWNADLENTIAKRTADLALANATMAGELAEAATYARAVLPKQLQGKVETHWIFETSSELGGDSFGYHWIDEDNLAIYLLDVCGHGVGAALLSVSVVNVLRTGSLSDTDFLDPAAVLRSLNETFPMERHNDMYFTAWYGVYSPSSRRLHYACGGHPPAILISPQGEATRLGAPGTIVGAFPAAVYKNAEMSVPPESRLYLFSDGVYEIDRTEGGMINYDGFLEILRKHRNDGGIAAVTDEIKRILGGNSFADDFSLVECVFHSE